MVAWGQTVCGDGERNVDFGSVRRGNMGTEEKSHLDLLKIYHQLPTPVFSPGEFHGHRSLAGY